MRRADTIFVPDDARVVTYSELAAAYAEHGQLRTLADHYGVVASTVMRHLHAAGVSTKRVAVSEVAMLRARVAELEEKIAKGDDRSPCVCSSHRGTCTKATCDHPEMWF